MAYNGMDMNTKRENADVHIAEEGMDAAQASSRHQGSMPLADEEPKPLRQGDLDGLCGLYALINAARRAAPSLPPEACKDLFRESLEWLQANGHLPEAFHRRIRAKVLLCLHGRVIRRRRPDLKLRRPFFSYTPTSDEEFLAAMASFLETPRRALLAAICSGQWSHWTVIHRITQG